MLDNVERFDMLRKPQRQHLRPLMWLLCYPDVWSHRCKIEKINMEGIKPPYILLQNHNSFLDFKVLTAAVFPHRCNYVVAIDGFIKREGLLRSVGGICKRKFTNDIILVRQLKRVLDNQDIAVIYPEARYSLCGTNSMLPESVGKLAKLYKVPVVTLITHGNHITQPFYYSKPHHVKGLSATLKCIATQEEIENISYQEVNDRINKEFEYDDYKWQKENKIRNKYKNRAVGLDKVLYQCPKCNQEYNMISFTNHLKCNNCQNEWEMNEYGELHCLTGDDIFTHIPDWYNWERDNVRKEIESGSYHFEDKVRVKALPNAKGFIDLKDGYLVHDYEGFHLKGNYQGEDYAVDIKAKDAYSVHIEYNYLFKYGDCVDLNTLDDTLYVYPYRKDCSVTKISLATEEMYKYIHNQ